MGHFYQCPVCGHEKCVCIKSGETVSTTLSDEPLVVDHFYPSGEIPKRMVPRFDSPDMGEMVEKLLTVKEGYEKEVIGQGADGGGLRMNKGKVRFDLLPPEWDQALADVTTQGEKKYEARNWEKGMDWSAMIGCIRRHLNKFLAGERYDGTGFDLEKGTTGCHHLAMVAWNVLALMSYDTREIGNNDLPKEVTLQLLNRLNAATSDMGNEINDD